MLSPKSINHESGSAAYVIPSPQLGTKTDKGEVRLSEYPHMFVIGDAADAFGVLESSSAVGGQVSRSPHTFDSTFAYALSSGEASRQEYHSITKGQGPPPEAYTTPPVGIKVTVSLGLTVPVLLRP